MYTLVMDLAKFHIKAVVVLLLEQVGSLDNSLYGFTYPKNVWQFGR